MDDRYRATLTSPSKLARMQDGSRRDVGGTTSPLSDSMSQMEVDETETKQEEPVMTLNQIFYEVENVSNTVEVILRGKIHTIDIPKFLKDLDEIYDYFHRRSKTDFEEVISTNSNKYLEIGVKLQNKIRNLSSNNLQYLEIRTTIRAICCWIFLYFGELSAKSYLIILKVLAKCGYDFHHHLAEQSALSSDLYNSKKKFLCRALVCYDTQLQLFESADDLQVYHRLPPLEIQDVRMAVFRSIVGSMKILFEVGGHPDWEEGEENPAARRVKLMDELHRRLILARSMVSSLHLRYRICLVELLFEIIRDRLSQEGGEMSDAINYYTTALDILEIPNDRVHDSEDREEDASLYRRKIDLEMRAYLALCFIHTEIGETTKARACLEAAERNPVQADDVKALSRLAKLTIFLREDHLEYAESCLRDYVLDATINYPETKAAMKKWLDYLLVRQNPAPDVALKITELFKVFATRFPNDPEYSNIRILHLQAMIQFSAASDQDKYAAKIFETANRLLTDHCHSIHVLSQDNFKVFKNLLLDQLKLQYDSQSWSNVKAWSDLVLKLVADDIEILVHCNAIKVEALLRLQSYSEALDCAQGVLSKQTSTRSLLTFFKCLLHFDSISSENVLLRFVTAQDKMHSFSTDPPTGNTSQIIEAQFCQLHLCCSICQESAVEAHRKNKVLFMLLKHWIELCCKHRVWIWDSVAAVTKPTSGSTPLIDVNADDNKVPSLLNISCQFMTYYLNEFAFMEAEFPASPLLSTFQTIFEDEAHSTEERKLPTAEFQIKRGFGSDISTSPNDFPVLNTLRSLHATLKLLENVLDEALRVSPLSVLGTEEELRWLINASQSIGNKLLEHGRQSAVRTVAGAIGAIDGKQKRDLLMWGSEFLLSSEHLLSLIPSFNSSVLKERVKLLVFSAAARLDCCEMMKIGSSGGSNPASQSELSMQSLSMPSFQRSYKDAGESAKNLAEKASALLQMHFDFADDEDKKLAATALTLQFGCFDVLGDREQSEAFLSGKVSEVQSMNIEDLREIIDIVENSLQFSMDAFRSLLQHGIKAVTANIKAIKSHEDRSFLGRLYCKAIEISPSRRQALEKLHEFEQLLRSFAKHAVGFEERGTEIVDRAEVDKIIALSYNYAVTLIDLDQVSLAEQFLSKAIGLVKYGSHQAEEWTNKMQETNSHLIKLKLRDSQTVSKANIISVAGGGGKDEESKGSSNRLKSPELGKMVVGVDSFLSK